MALVLVAGLAPGTVRAGAEPDPIRICMHVPITGAAPIPHHPDRFGAFYFHYVNEKLGGIDGRPVEMRAINDQYYPAGARRAVQICEEAGTDLYVGAFGRDQIHSVARWAEDRQVPYLHGSAAAADTASLEWSAMLGPSDEEQLSALAHMLVDNAGNLTGGVEPVFGMVRIDSPSYTAGRDTFETSLGSRGYALRVDRAVQKDENQFSDVWSELRLAGVNVVVLFLNPNLSIRLMAQAPLGYAPALAGVAPEMGWDKVAVASANWPAPFIALHDASPVFVDPRNGDPNDVPWGDEIAEFLEIFREYSPEQQPGPNDFDWSFYLRAKQLHRILLALDGDLTPSNVRDVLSTYQETPEDAFPSCTLDFGAGDGIGSRSWHLFSQSGNRWHQAAFCADKDTTLDLAELGPRIECDAPLRVTFGDPLRCEVSEMNDGILHVRASFISAPTSPEPLEVDGACRPEEELELDLPPGVHEVLVQAWDCAGRTTTERLYVVRLP